MGAKKYPFTQNRELSWLRFNDRVLSEAMDETLPLLERLKFISIFTSNLDEFFMIRVGSLFDMMHVKAHAIDNKSGMTPKEQLEHIYQRCASPLQKSGINSLAVFNCSFAPMAFLILLIQNWNLWNRNM